MGRHRGGTGNGQTIADSFICIGEAVLHPAIREYLCVHCLQAHVQVRALRFVPIQGDPLYGGSHRTAFEVM